MSTKHLSYSVVYCHCLLLCLMLNSNNGLAQITDSNATIYAPVNENLFVNTKWKYTYTTHAESNTIIHKADEEYKYFIFFRMRKIKCL